MSTIKQRVVNGKTLLSMPEAARQIGTTTTVIKRLMGEGVLDYDQVTANGKILIPLESVVKYRLEKLDKPEG
jgi:hypothetical protein